MRTPLALLVLLAAGCSTLSVTTDWDRDANFAALRTYAWMQPPAAEPDPFNGNTIVKKRVVAAIERELAAKGVAKTDSSPSFLVAMHGWARDRLDVTSWPSWGHSWDWHGDNVQVWQYTEGAFILDFVNPATKELLWRGVAKSVIDSSSGSVERVDEAIHKLLEDFPPTAPPK
jgi:hypothetical protein